MVALLVQAVAVQSIMAVASKDVFCLSAQRTMELIFVGECNEFPCEKTQGLFEEIVYRQWLEGNQQIREYGIEAFWKNNAENPHYKPYKK